MSTPELSTDSLVGAANQATGMGADGSGGVSAQMMLDMIFGKIAENPMGALTSMGAGNDTVLSIIFMYINVGLLTLGSVYLTYKTMAAITQTAHDGDFIGKAFHTVWVPIRVTTGIMSLVPIAGGWNALQVVMLWIGVMGAGLGNLTWQAVVTGWMDTGVVQYAGNGGKTQKTNVAATIRFGNSMLVANKVFEALLCDEAHLRTSGGATPNPDPFIFDGGGSYCGKVSVSGQDGIINGADSKTRNGSTLGMGGDTLAKSVEAATSAITKGMILEMRGVAKEAINEVVLNLQAATDPDAPQGILMPNFNKYLPRVRSIGASYQTKINEAVYSILNGAAYADKMSVVVKAAARDYGFVSAGSFYTAYANSSYAIKGAGDTNGMVDVTVNKSGHSNTVYDSAMDYYSAAKGKSAISGATPDSSDSEQGAFKLLKEKMGWGGLGGDSLISAFIRNDMTAPALINIKNTADNAVTFAGVGVTAIGGIMGMKDSVLGRIADNATGGVAGGAITPWLDMTKLVLQMSLGFFLMCSIYLPLVPYIVFMGQVMEWLASVILGVAAAPFLAFAHFDTDGEGLGQRTQYGYTFMLQSFMRPVMLVLGFVLASAMIEVSIYFLTATYSFAVADAQVHSMTGLFSVFGYCALYMVLAVGLVNTSCSLMHLLPDAVFEFMGARSVGLGFGTNTAANAMQSALAGAGASRVVGKMPGGEKSGGKPDGNGTSKSDTKKKVADADSF